jgi:hypothetical protein
MTDFNKRIKREYKKNKSKKIDKILIQNIKVEEILDDTGETEDDTIMRISFDGILLHMRIPTGMKLCEDLKKILNFKK